MYTIQQQIDALGDSIREQRVDISSASSEASPNSDFSTYLNLQFSHVGFDIRSDFGCRISGIPFNILTYLACGKENANPHRVPLTS